MDAKYSYTPRSGGRRVFLLVGAAVAAIIVGYVVLAASWARTMTVSTVDGANIAHGFVSYYYKAAGFTMLSFWETEKNDAVVKVLILEKSEGGISSWGHFDSETDYAIGTGGTEESENDFTYQYKAWRNRTIDFSIEDALYDLDKGTVFLIRVQNGDVEVQQIYADLSDVEPLSDSGGYDVQAFCETNDVVLAFLLE